MPVFSCLTRVSRARIVFGAVVAALGVAAGCDDTVAPEPRYELVDSWLGTFRGDRVGFELLVVVESETDGRLTGFATGWSGRYDLTGVYEPPTVYLHMTTDTDTLAFLGEAPVNTFLSGTVVLDSESLFDQSGVLLARR